MSDQKSYGHKGKINRYTCDKCGGQIVTVDADNGTTPFMLQCQPPWRCRGMMTSEFYRVDQSLVATHEFYRMSDLEAKDQSPAMMQHHLMGGLAFRKRA